MSSILVKCSGSVEKSIKLAQVVEVLANFIIKLNERAREREREKRL